MLYDEILYIEHDHFHYVSLTFYCFIWKRFTLQYVITFWTMDICENSLTELLQNSKFDLALWIATQLVNKNGIAFHDFVKILREWQCRNFPNSKYLINQNGKIRSILVYYWFPFLHQLLYTCTVYHRRRIDLENKAKVVAADWGTKSLPH